MTFVRLTVPGESVGKGRPRFVRQTGRMYTPARTLRAEERIREEWVRNGSHRLPDGPLDVYVESVRERPLNHYKVDGGLSVQGLRLPYAPGGGKHADLDNILKLVGDSLNGHAYKDDRQFVMATISRRWADAGEREHLFIVIQPATLREEAA